MSLTYLTARVGNPQNGKTTTRRMLVDSGATYSVVPSTVLKKLNIKAIDTQKFTLANGEEIVKEIGEARFEIQGKRRTAPVIFGDKNIWLIGATTLENMGFILDPINRKLKSLPMVI